MENHSTVLSNLDVGSITNQVKAHFTSNNMVIPNIGNTNINNCIDTTKYYHNYPLHWFTYSTDSNFNKVLVTKAENGFVLVYNNKTYIAKNENEVAKIIVKVTKGENNG